MGCSPSTLQQTSATTDSCIPTSKELMEPILKMPGEPSLLTLDDHKVSSNEPIRFAIQKTNRNHTGDSFRVTNVEADRRIPHDDDTSTNSVADALGEVEGSCRTTLHKGNEWNYGKHLFVEPIFRFGGPQTRLEGTTGVYQGEEAVPVAYWTCDIAKGRNHFKILREKPVYKGQAKAFTITGRDQNDIPIKAATPFVGRTVVDFFSYANVVFDKDTKIVSIKVFGAPKCTGGVPLYQLRQATSSSCWILYRFGYSEERYRVCAALVQQKGQSKGYPLYETTISPGIDPVFVLCLASILDAYWANKKLKPKLRLFG